MKICRIGVGTLQHRVEVMGFVNTWMHVTNPLGLDVWIFCFFGDEIASTPMHIYPLRESIQYYPVRLLMRIVARAFPFK